MSTKKTTRTVQDEQAARLIDAIAEDEEKKEFPHKWIYSFLPGTVNVQTWVGAQMENVGSEELYLLGFCILCKKVFSVRVARTEAVGEVTISQTDVPSWGCVPPNPLIPNPTLVRNS